MAGDVSRLDRIRIFGDAIMKCARCHTEDPADFRKHGIIETPGPNKTVIVFQRWECKKCRRNQKGENIFERKV